jgi:hypothetical protein
MHAVRLCASRRRPEGCDGSGTPIRAGRGSGLRARADAQRGGNSERGLARRPRLPRGAGSPSRTHEDPDKARRSAKAAETAVRLCSLAQCAPPTDSFVTFVFSQSTP